MTAAPSFNEKSRIYVAGHRGLVGSAIVRRLEAGGFTNIITKTHAELDLERELDVDRFFSAERPEFVFLAAAKVGGIHANNTYPVDFLLRNLRIQNNVIESSWRHGAKGLLFLGSSCIYPREAPQPLKEEYLLTGPLEPTNEPYAVAKIAGIKLCQAFNRQYGTRFISVMPTNLYGPNDNYDLETSHVLPALIRKFHLGKLAAKGNWGSIEKNKQVYGIIPSDFLDCLLQLTHVGGHCVGGKANFQSNDCAVTLWGNGKPRREFLYSDDLAEACVFLMERLGSLMPWKHESNHRYPAFLFNVGSGEEVPILDLAGLVSRIVGFEGNVKWDDSKSSGTPRKLLDSGRMVELGWKPSIGLEEGVLLAYEDYLGKL